MRSIAAPPRHVEARRAAGRWSELMSVSWRGSLVEDEAILALIGSLRLDLVGDAVDAVELAEQNAGGITGVGIAVVRTRQLLLRDRAHDVGADNDHQLGLPVDVVAALEQRAEDRQLHQARNAVELLLGLFVDHARKRQRSAGGNLHRRLGA